jgi:hypothetical protein
MNTIEKVLDMTINIRRYITDGRTASAARKYNGAMITTTLDYHGIICAYLDQNDLWIYWIETGVLTHYKSVQASRIVGEVTNQIKHDREGEESVIVPKAYREQFMALNKGPLTKKKKESVAKAATTVAEAAPKVLFNGGIFDITIADMGTVRVIGKNADDAWNVLRERCQIDMVG